MTDSTQILIVGIAGMAATLIASALGLYFIARARTAPLRHLLYAKQLELFTDTMELIGKARNYLVILAEPSSEFSETARQDLSEAVPELSRLTNTAAAILPTDVYVEMSRLLSSVTDFAVGCDEGQVDETFPTTFGAQSAKVALLGRSSLGIDELSDESLKLFGNTEDMQRLANLTADGLRTTRNDET